MVKEGGNQKSAPLLKPRERNVPRRTPPGAKRARRTDRYKQFDLELRK